MRQLTYQFELIRAIRKFFDEKGFIDVLTPPMVENPGMEVHIHPFQIQKAKDRKLTDLYLHTSPEFYMKELLGSNDFEKIFTISYCFRDEPSSKIHRNQFLMLEWYRKDSFYSDIMSDIEELIKHCHSHLKNMNLPVKKEITEFQKITVEQLFQQYLHFNILEYLNVDDLKNKIKVDFKDVILPDQDCAWDDYFFLLFLNKIEPHLAAYPYLLIYEYPAPLAALSTIKESDPRVCERFEVYLNGIELCNCFNELTDYQEQVKRFELASKKKNEIYDYQLPWPKKFLSNIERGYPKSAGIALGVERLLIGITDIKNPFFTEENS